MQVPPVHKILQKTGYISYYSEQNQYDNKDYFYNGFMLRLFFCAVFYISVKACAQKIQKYGEHEHYSLIAVPGVFEIKAHKLNQHMGYSAAGTFEPRYQPENAGNCHAGLIAEKSIGAACDYKDCAVSDYLQCSLLHGYYFAGVAATLLSSV